MLNPDFIHLGSRNSGGYEFPFGLSHGDLSRHLYCLGKTGSGKSTLLRNLIVQKIYSGDGLGLIDVHGSLAKEILEIIPPQRREDVVYFNPGDLDFPIGFNFLSGNRNRRDLIASGLVGAFKNIWSDSWGPRLEYILCATISALLDCENVSLLGLSRMLSDSQYRAWVTKQIDDPMVHAFWTKEFAAYSDRFRDEALSPIQNKVGILMMSPVLRNVVGQIKSKIDPRFMMDNRRIFIANLSKGSLGEDKASLLGSLLVTQFQLAAMAREEVPEDHRESFTLVIDEFQNFATESFSSILSECRKYNLALVLSHQYTEQLRPKIRDAVLGNVGSIIAFNVGSLDA